MCAFTELDLREILTKEETVTDQEQGQVRSLIQMQEQPRSVTSIGKAALVTGRAKASTDQDWTLLNRLSHRWPPALTHQAGGPKNVGQ
jgi:hypothetical protein